MLQVKFRFYLQWTIWVGKILLVKKKYKTVNGTVMHNMYCRDVYQQHQHYLKMKVRNHPSFLECWRIFRRIVYSASVKWYWVNPIFFIRPSKVLIFHHSLVSRDLSISFCIACSLVYLSVFIWTTRRKQACPSLKGTNENCCTKGWHENNCKTTQRYSVFKSITFVSSVYTSSIHFRKILQYKYCLWKCLLTFECNGVF